jgi:hypothetical protein
LIGVCGKVPGNAESDDLPADYVSGVEVHPESGLTLSFSVFRVPKVLDPSTIGSNEGASFVEAADP